MEISLAKFKDEVETLQRLFAANSAPNAEARYDILKTVDPYPSIKPTLLNAGQIASYALATGMIDPFDVKRLSKPITYLVPLEGPCRYRDADGVEQRFYLSTLASERKSQVDKVRNQIELGPNSICYVTLEPYFRMPAYIACRFNLKITEVYRGLLVGTGPIVDPGFHGKLSVPIYNFTSTPYSLRAGEGFVYFEFTKIDWENSDEPLPSWVGCPLVDQPPFPVEKTMRKSLDDYLAAATGNGPPQNALMEDIKNVKEISAAVDARLKTFTILGAIGIVSLIIGVASMIFSALQFVHRAQAELRQVHEPTAVSKPGSTEALQ